MVGLSWKWSFNEKWFLIFKQLVSYVKKFKISTFARMDTFIEDKKKISHFFFSHLSL